MKLFARGTWQGSISALNGCMARFSKKHQEAVFGQHGWRFAALCLANETHITELTDGGGNLVEAGPGTQWGIGHIGYNAAACHTGSPEEPDPNFQGWPAGWLSGFEVAGGFAVELSYQEGHYPDEIRGYLRLLWEALVADGLKPLEEPAAPGGEAGGKEVTNLELWERIPDHKWDRRAVELWCKGYSYKDIGRQTRVSWERVRNRLSELRQAYPDIILVNSQRKKRRQLKRT